MKIILAAIRKSLAPKRSVKKTLLWTAGILASIAFLQKVGKAQEPIIKAKLESQKRLADAQIASIEAQTRLATEQTIATRKMHETESKRIGFRF